MNRRRVVALLVLVLALVVLAACAKPSAPAVMYHCPMHPSVVSDRPGDCPICGMRLVPSTPAAATPKEAPAHAERVPVDLGADAARRAGITTVQALPGTLPRTVRVPGIVAVDERGVRHVHTKVAGLIEKLYVNFTGEAVVRGQKILELYSPELLASQEEYLRARETAAKLAASSLPEVREGAEQLIDAARRRLLLLDVTPEAIAQLEARGHAERTVTLYAPADGLVTAKEAFEGRQVGPETDLFVVTDFAQVWVEAQVYEADARDIRQGLHAAISAPFDPAASVTGTASWIAPSLERETRTLTVRFDVANPRGTLRPGMFVDVAFDLGGGHGVLIPDTAVVDTGARQVVFVERAPGAFDPREVEVARRSGGQALVTRGLAAGDTVAERGAFLLDSESRLAATTGAGK